jgi:hypothetical protein
VEVVEVLEIGDAGVDRRRRSNGCKDEVPSHVDLSRDRCARVSWRGPTGQ